MMVKVGELSFIEFHKDGVEVFIWFDTEGQVSHIIETQGFQEPIITRGSQAQALYELIKTEENWD